LQALKGLRWIWLQQQRQQQRQQQQWQLGRRQSWILICYRHYQVGWWRMQVQHMCGCQQTLSNWVAAAAGTAAVPCVSQLTA
jgi:hypothetical protein